VYFVKFSDALRGKCRKMGTTDAADIADKGKARKTEEAKAMKPSEVRPYLSV
jgi:hypothetical protein